ncbi:MAG: S8 family peptidase [Spirochaetia bacterium]|nr:S8 family peptidase [Spirochaetota bacterium]MCX8097248.1 S8 family peptidase [Spirochaetota bacterium]MDW8111856.1 S8 family peptidase [Spirochaetia bacterium]
MKVLSYKYLVLLYFILSSVFIYTLPRSVYSTNISADLLTFLEIHRVNKEDKRVNVLSQTRVGRVSSKSVDLLVEIDSISPQISKYLLRTFSGSGRFAVLRVPIEELGYILGDTNLVYATLPRKVKLHLDMVRDKLNLNYIYNYYGQDKVQGKDVIIGVIDSGIDSSHADFRTSSGSSRILYVWDQTVDVTNSRLGYGREYTKSELDRDLGLVKDEEGHGTHVSGIATGNGRMSSGKYSGISQGSDLIVVKTDFSIIGILEGIEYIFLKSRELGKSCVVNLSLGLDIGSHDGSDIESLVLKDIINSYGREGKVIVVSAGNSGYFKQHFSNTITLIPISSVLEISSNSTREADELVADFWVDGGVVPEVRIVSPNGNTSGWITFSNNYTKNVSLPDGEIIVSMVSNRYNNDLNIQITFLDTQSKSISTGNWQIQFKTISGTSILHGWLQYSDGIISQFSNGDNYFTINSMFLIDEVIFVSSYNSRNSFSSTSGNIYLPRLTNDNISYFSSRGPTRDGRKKPDISAPGAVIFAPLSSQSERDGYVDKTYRNYIGMMGTSMSAPVVAGVVALLLSVNPKFTSSDIINYLKTYSEVSIYDLNGKNWDESWGWGKVNVKTIVETLKTPEDLVWFSGNVVRLDNFQNSTLLNFRLKDGSDNVSIDIYDMEGNLMKSMGNFYIQSGLNQINLVVDNSFRTGVYLVRIAGNRFNTNLKLVIIR